MRFVTAALQSLPGQAAYDDNHIKAQEIFGEELPVVPLYLRLKLAATRPDFCNFIMDQPTTVKSGTSRTSVTDLCAE